MRFTHSTLGYNSASSGGSYSSASNDLKSKLGLNGNGDLLPYLLPLFLITGGLAGSALTTGVSSLLSGSGGSSSFGEPDYRFSN